MVSSVRIDEQEYARVILDAFSIRNTLLGFNITISVTCLCDALRYARIKCAKNEIDNCIEWARRTVKKRGRQRYC